MEATERTEPGATEYTEYREYGAMPWGVRLLSRLLPSDEREAVLGDLLEDAAHRDLDGVRLQWWLARQLASIGGGLSIVRVRGWLVLPPVREVVSGFAVDGRGLLRGTHPFAALFRALVFCGSLATMMLGVELLVRTLLSAAGL